MKAPAVGAPEMPSKDLDVKTIAAVAAGLCLAAGAASFLTSDGTPSSIVLAPATSFIVIEDEFEIVSFDAEAVDPDAFAASMGILIEDDDESVLLRTEEQILVEDELSIDFFASLAASVAAIVIENDVPETPAASSPASRSSVAAPAPAPRSSRDTSDELATRSETPVASSSRQAPTTSITGFHRAELRPVGPLSTDEIQSAIHRQLPKVRQCYERELKSDTNLGGHMILSMQVQPSGVVTRAGVKEEDIGSDELTSCVERAVQSFTFPRGTESVSVEYPVTLKASRW